MNFLAWHFMVLKLKLTFTITISMEISSIANNLYFCILCVFRKYANFLLHFPSNLSISAYWNFSLSHVYKKFLRKVTKIWNSKKKNDKKNPHLVCSIAYIKVLHTPCPQNRQSVMNYWHGEQLFRTLYFFCL